MGLVNHDNDKQDEKKKTTAKRKSLLNRGPEILVKNQVSREDVTKVLEPESVSYAINIRVDNHIRNQLSALQNLGIGDSARDALASLIEERVGKLDESSYRRYHEMVDILERKDAMKHPNRK